ncbi:MAG: glutamine--fructose-6-phosphate transaminase (isomerizing) [Bacteroidetes bacterium]|nr:glutamine--fructose-6-phosphate aminotransferase [Rhodothermaceae bacterium RA]RMH67533.1 MAG: glutamine--fructose-6-phosphate transaminase (isomerizing) [Bacteroidota bacterium]
MCGIIGYIGRKPVERVLLTGLHRLEYRGYDSAGVATLNGSGGIHVRRVVGRVRDLERHLQQDPVPGTLGIAHTRWATHGRPSEINAHPHLDASGRLALVHNGIIENHDTIRTFLEGQGIPFRSETDTEALVQLIGFLYDQTGDLVESVRRALRDVDGTYGIALLCRDAPETLIAARRGSPLLVGIGEDEYLVSSDGSAIIEHTSQVVYLQDGEIAVLGPAGLTITTTDAVPVEAEVSELEMTLEQIELAGFEHHMLKEIYEQPETLRDTMRGRIDAREGRVKLGGLVTCEREIARARRLLLAGCGTAWHAALVGEYLFEELARVPTEVEYASELRYRNPIIDEGTLALVISQSGETADTLAALREMKTKGATVLGVVNVVGSTIARETDAGVYLRVGPEIGVASTKAFTAQIAVLAMLAVDMGRRRHLSPWQTAEVLAELEAIPEKVEQALKLDEQVQDLARQLVDRDNWLYLGRGVNYPVALEGALKLKEISYIHAEGLPAAEMKHGPIALIDKGMPVVVVAPRDHMHDKIVSNIEEIRSRQGRVIAVTTEGDTRLRGLADAVLEVPATLPILSPLVTTIPLQLLAYHCARLRGHDVDKPRNLAKSVTVE